MRSGGDARDDALRQGLVLAAFVFALGLLTRTRDFGGDDTVFARTVEAWLAGRGSAGELLATYHPAYNPIVAGATWLVRLVAPRALVLDVGAAVSSFFWGAATGGLCWVLRRHGAGAARALLVSSAVAACGGMWCIGTRMEVYTLAAAAAVGWLAACSGERPRAARVGVALAAAVLAHAALSVLALPTVWRLRRNPRTALVALSIGAGIPALATLAVFVLARSAATPAAWLALVVPQESVGYVEPGSARLFPRALEALVVWRFYREVPVLLPAAARGLGLAGGIACALSGALVLAGLWRTLRDGTDRLGRTSALALAAFLPLWLVWDVGNFEHTVAAAPLFGVLLARGAAALPHRLGEHALAALVLLLLVTNGLGGAALGRRPENGRLWVTAGFVQERVASDALILGVGTDARLRLGLSYLTGRHVADLTLAVRSARIAGRPAEDGLAWWVARARRAGELWALDDVLDPRSEPFIEGLGIARATWRSVVAELSPVSTAVLEPDGAVVREPFRIHRLAAVPALRAQEGAGASD